MQHMLMVHCAYTNILYISEFSTSLVLSLKESHKYSPGFPFRYGIPMTLTGISRLQKVIFAASCKNFCMMGVIICCLWLSCFQYQSNNFSLKRLCSYKFKHLLYSFFGFFVLGFKPNNMSIMSHFSHLSRSRN